MQRETGDLNWQRLPGHESLKGRAGHSTTLVGSKLFILGGRNRDDFFDDLWVFDLEQEQWNQLQPKVPFSPRAYHTATLIDDQYLWVLGGSNHDTLFDDVHVLNTTTLQWTCPVIKGSIAIRSRGTHAAVLHPFESRAILVFGGYGGTDPHWLGDLSLLRTDSLEWYALNPGGTLPCPRGYHSLTTVGAYAVLFGGKGGAGIVKEDLLSMYDFVENKWFVPKVEGDAPLPRSNHAATFLNPNLIVMHGGRHGAIRLIDTCVLRVSLSISSISTLKWHVLEKTKSSVKSRQSLGKRKTLNVDSDSPLGRSAHCLIARGHALYIFGGYGGQGLAFNDIFVLRNLPTLPAFDQQNANDPMPSDAQAPILIADNSDDEDVHLWRSTKRRKHQSHQRDKLVSRIQEVGQILKQGLDVTSTKKQNEQDKIGLQPQESGDQMQKQLGHVPQVQDIARDKALVMIEQEKTMLEKDILGLQEQIESLKTNIKEKTCIEDELRTDKLHLQKEITSLNERRGDLANVIRVLEKKVQLSAEKNKNLECQNENMKTQIQDLRSSLEEKERKNSELAQEVRDAHQTYEELKETSENEKTFCVEVVRERDEYKTCVERLQLELEKQMQALQQLSLKFENEKTFLKHEIGEMKATRNKLLTDLGMSKESTRALQDVADRQTKQLEDEKSKVCALQKDKDELRQSNAVAIAENKQLLAAKDIANSHVDFLKSEVQATRALHEQASSEIIRLQKQVEQSKEHITSLHDSLKKNEENIKIKDQELGRLRVLINEVEQFEQTQMTKLQQHLEKLRCVRQSCPI